MNTNKQCVNPNCRQELKSQDAAYCSVCGWHTSHIAWSLKYRDQERSISDVPPKEEERYALLPGDQVTLCASNSRPVPVKVTIDTSALTGFEHILSELVDVMYGKPMEFVLKCNATASRLSGELKLISMNGPRDSARWNITTTPLPTPIRIHQWLTMRQQRWVASAPGKIYFVPGVNRQQIQFWNASDDARILRWGRLYGYQVTPLSLSQPSDPITQVEVEAGKTETLEVVRLSIVSDEECDKTLKVQDAGDFDFEILPGTSTERTDLEDDAIIAIDFGTRNTSMRVRWIQAGDGINKPRHTTQCIGESDRFPSLMICKPNGTIYKWGTEAEKALPKLTPQDNLIVVDDLKTFLREGVNNYPGIEVSTQVLLENYFHELIREIDQLFKSRGVRLKRRIRYVVCHPVLDSASLSRYLSTLEAALEPHGISTAQGNLTFVPEPEAAAHWIAHKFPEKLQHLEVGDRIAVIDSGGGTTDITVAEVVKIGSPPILEMKKNAALCIDRSAQPLSDALQYFSALGASEDRQFGGNVLDAMLAYILTAEGFQYVSANRRGYDLPFPIDIDDSGVDAQGRRLTAVDVRPPITIPVSSTSDQERIAHRLCARIIKEDVVQDGKKKYLYESDQNRRNPFPHRVEDYKHVYVPKEVCDQWVVEEALQSATTRFKQDNQELLKLSPYTLFYVGGTCTDIKVREQMSGIFGLQYEDENARMEATRMNAVVEGAVRSQLQESFPSPISLWLCLKHPKYPDPIPLIRQGAELLPREQLTFNDRLIFMTLPEDWQPELWAESAVEQTSPPTTPTKTQPSSFDPLSASQERQKFLLARGFYHTMKSGMVKPIWVVSREGVEVNVLIEPDGQSAAVTPLPLWRFTLTGENR